MLATQQFRRALFVGLVASAALAAELQTQSQTKIAVDYRSGMELTGTEPKSAKQCLGKNVNHCLVDHCGEDAVASGCGEGDENPGGGQRLLRGSSQRALQHRVHTGEFEQRVVQGGRWQREQHGVHDVLLRLEEARNDRGAAGQEIRRHFVGGCTRPGFEMLGVMVHFIMMPEIDWATASKLDRCRGRGGGIL